MWYWPPVPYIANLLPTPGFLLTTSSQLLFLVVEQCVQLFTLFLFAMLEVICHLTMLLLLNTKCIQSLRCSLFRKTKANIENLPPTKDALVQHILRAHYQTLVWKQCLVAQSSLPSPMDCGWYIMNKELKPCLMTTEALSPKCIELVSCNCKETGYQCQTNHCACKKQQLRCTKSCGCGVWCKNPNNDD